MPHLAPVSFTGLYVSRLQCLLSCSFCPWDLSQDLVPLDTQCLVPVTEGQEAAQCRALSLEIRFAPVKNTKREFKALKTEPSEPGSQAGGPHM